MELMRILNENAPKDESNRFQQLTITKKKLQEYFPPFYTKPQMEKDGCKHINLAANVCGYTPINLGKIIKDGILSDIESIHRVTIDRAMERKLKSSDFN